MRLAAALLAVAGLPLVVALNRYGADPLHRANRRWLSDRYGFDTVIDPMELADRWGA